MGITTGQTAAAADALALRKTVWMHSIANTLMNSVWSDVVAWVGQQGGSTMKVEIDGSPLQVRAVTTDWASATTIEGIIILAGFLYAMLNDGTNSRLYRYSSTNIAAGGTLMTVSGQAFGTTVLPTLTTDGTNFYFNYKAGGSANDYVLSKYTLSGTTITYVSDITCGSTANTVNYLLGFSSGGPVALGSTDSKIRRYNSSGTIQATSGGYQNANCAAVVFGLVRYVGYQIDVIYNNVTIP